MIDLTNPSIPDLLQKWGHIAEVVKPINRWDDPLEICWWCEYASQCTNLLELGAYDGCSTRAMSLANPAMYIHVIDLWEDGNHGEFLKNTQEFGKRLTHTKGDTHTELRVLRDYHPEIIFNGLLVDAGHTYDCVKGDLELALSIVEKGTLVCGHDYRANNPDEPLNKAVHERFSQVWNPVCSIWCAYNN